MLLTLLMRKKIFNLNELYFSSFLKPPLTILQYLAFSHPNRYYLFVALHSESTLLTLSFISWMLSSHPFTYFVYESIYTFTCNRECMVEFKTSRRKHRHTLCTLMIRWRVCYTELILRLYNETRWTFANAYRLIFVQKCISLQRAREWHAAFFL